MKKMMNRMLSILMMLLVAFEADAVESYAYAVLEEASAIMMKEAEMSVMQNRQRQRNRRRTRTRRRSTRVNEVSKEEQTSGTVKINEVAKETKHAQVDLDTLTAPYVAQDGDVLTGTAGSYKITIADKATVILNGVDITHIPDVALYEYAGITCEGDATIVLAKGTSNKVKGGYENRPGIYVAKGKTLTIKGPGSLESSSQGWAAGIGGGKDLECGNIVIEEGIVIAKGGNNAAAIGSGWSGSCGDIVIRPTVTLVTLIREGNGGGYIGAGKDGSCGKVTIADGAQVIEE